jgi:peptidoglycan/xylan/chitin deacetylase (PgdA/CDA1 family)
MTGWKAFTRATLAGAYKYSGAMWLHESLADWCGQQFMTILLFHRITDIIPEDSLTVSPRRFRQICQMLARSFHVVPLGEIFRILRAGERMPRRTVAITFDDSYLDNLDASRVLADCGLPATFFIPTDFIGSDLVFDWDRNLPSMPNLSWDDVRTMARMGFEIGSHTVTHANLGAVSYEQARNEIFGSKTIIEEQLGQRVRWFAYPFGGLNHLRSEYAPLITEAGYDGGVSAYGGFIRQGSRTVSCRARRSPISVARCISSCTWAAVCTGFMISKDEGQTLAILRPLRTRKRAIKIRYLYPPREPSGAPESYF